MNKFMKKNINAGVKEYISLNEVLKIEKSFKAENPGNLRLNLGRINAQLGNGRRNFYCQERNYSSCRWY